MNNEEIPPPPVLDFSEMKKISTGKIAQLKSYTFFVNKLLGRKYEKGKFLCYSKGEFVYAEPSGVQAFFSQIRSKKRTEPVIVYTFIYFSILLKENFRNISYVIDKPVYIVKDHFLQIGSVLDGNSFCIDSFEIKIPISFSNLGILPNGVFKFISDNVNKDCGSIIEKLTISHSKEICCEQEMIVIAELVTKLKVKELKVSMKKLYVKNVKEFYDGMVLFKNKVLKKVEFIDESNPNEKIEMEELNELLKENCKVHTVLKEKIEVKSVNHPLDLCEEYKKDLNHNFVFSFSNDTSLELNIEEYPFFEKCNEILFEVTYPIKKKDEEFERIFSLVKKIKPKTPFQSAVYFFLNIKLFYIMKKYNEGFEFIKKNKIPKVISKVTLSWIYSVLSEICFHLGEKHVDDVVHYSNECIKVRVELNHSQDIISCCLNTIRYLTQFKRSDLMVDFNVIKMKYSLVIHDVSYLVESVVDVLKFLEDGNSKKKKKNKVKKDFIEIYNENKDFVNLIMKKNELFKKFLSKM